MENPCIDCIDAICMCQDCIERNTCEQNNACRNCSCSLIEEYLEADVDSF